MIAKYPGECPGCEQTFQPGTPIRIEGGDWYHEACPPPAEEVKPGEEACPVCWLIHPKGECDR